MSITPPSGRPPANSTEMRDGSSLPQLRDDVLREIGRNVLLFQHLEQLLKFVLNRGRVAGSLAQIKAILERLQTQPDRRTLGQLIEPLLENHLSTDAPLAEPPYGNNAPWLALQVGFQVDRKQREEFEQALERAVKARNDLIHHSLDWLRLDSVASCQKSLRRLQAMHQENQAVYESMKAIVNLAQTAAPLMEEELKKALQEKLKG